MPTFLVYSLLACLVVLSCSMSPGTAAESVGPLTVTVDPGQVLTRTFLGFGVQWEHEGDRPEINSDEPAWNKNWPVMLKRIDFMKPAILRVISPISVPSMPMGSRYPARHGRILT